MTTPDGWWSGLTDEILDDRRVVQLTPIDWSGPVPLRRDVLGRTGGSSLKLGEARAIAVSELKAAHESWFPAFMAA